MFILCICANLSYVGSILVHATTREDIEHSLPYIVGGFTAPFDLTILFQVGVMHECRGARSARTTTRHEPHLRYRYARFCTLSADLVLQQVFYGVQGIRRDTVRGAPGVTLRPGSQASFNHASAHGASLLLQHARHQKRAWRWPASCVQCPHPLPIAYQRARSSPCCGSSATS